MPPVVPPEEVTPEWLTERLRGAGHEDATVRSFTATQIGTGQLGKCIRYSLEVKGDEDAPRSLVGKYPSDDATSRQTGVVLRNYIKEVSFYRDLQQRVWISTPRCYYAAIEGQGPAFSLLLEDMAPAVQGDQLAGCSVEVARAAIMELPGLHAPTWNDESLAALGWLDLPTGATGELLRGLYKSQLPGFIARLGWRLAPEELAVIERVADSKGPPFVPTEGPTALVHVDYRLDNLLIDETQMPPRVTTVDWQTVTLGRPVTDVTYFLGAGLPREERMAVEGDLVREYYAGLCEAGVSGYSWDDCWLDYRRGVFAGLLITVIATVMVQPTARGDEMFVAMASRHSRHAIDLGAETFL
ncbi:MAG TPA: phosphotransferase [Dehalococcoidia bacterium]|nr:phosphotransferase [Dehalococcoidia bacterium]